MVRIVQNVKENDVLSSDFKINGQFAVWLTGISVSGAPPPAKRAHHAQPIHAKYGVEHANNPAILPLAPPPLNGRAVHPHALPHGVPLSRSNARKQVISWMDAPDDVYFRASESTKYVGLSCKM